MTSADVETGEAPGDEENRFGADAPTADVPDEDVVEFIRELNESLGAKITGSANGFSTTPVTRNAAPARRNAIDPANPPGLTSNTQLRIIDAYEECVESGEFAAAAALRRRDGLNDQNELSRRIQEYALGEDQ